MDSERLAAGRPGAATRRGVLKTGAIGAVAGVATPWMARAAQAEGGHAGASAPATTRATPEMNDNEGFSRERLERMHDVMASHVRPGLLPGLVMLVSRRGETRVDAVGTKEFGGSDPMQRDTIFRIASVSKPIVAAAAMTLIEECILRLDDPVDPLLPELANRRVLRTPESELDDTVPANRPLTLRDLLTFRLGYGAIFTPEQTPIQQAMAAAGLAPSALNPEMPPDEFMQRLGALPLLAQPGERWLYNTGSDVLGVLIARATGRNLGDVLQERIFDPLGMTDTGFSVPADKLDRLAGSYWTNMETGTFEVFDGIADSHFARPPLFESGAGGLVSTVDDLFAFGQMMRDNGTHKGERILSRPSIALMTIDHIAPEQKAISPFFPDFWNNRGWGFGVSVITRRDNLPDTPGRYGWDGGYGTSWYVDPGEDLIGILLTQHVWDGSGVLGAFADFWTLAYQAIAD